MTRRGHRIFVVLTIGALGAVGPLISIPVTATAETSCGTTNYRDLNRDGYEDAVVGDPYATVDGQAEAGTVTVLFGDADCRIGEGAHRTLTQADLGETPEAGDHFGWSVMLNETGSSVDRAFGMVIGSPGEDIGAHTNAGMAHVFTFAPLSEQDPDADGVVNLTQGDVGGTVETGDEFGYSLTARGGSSEEPVLFAFGAPGENVGEGVVNVTNSRNLGRNGVQVRRGSRGLPGKPQAGDRFGHVIDFIAVNVGAPSPADDSGIPLFVGAPGDVVAGHGRAGSVTAMWADPVGTLQGVIGPATLITQNSPTIPGVAEAGDQFGYSLAHNSRIPGYDQTLIAIGSPGEDIGSLANAGSVTVLRNVGSTLRKRITLTQNTSGVPGVVEAGDRFGSAVAFRDKRELLIGVPGEDLGAIREAGIAQIVRIGKSHISNPYAAFTENSPGTPGTVRAGNRFASGVSGLPNTDTWRRNDPGTGYGEGVFTISSEVQDGGSVYVVSSDPKVAPRSWQPGTGGIPGDGERFGHSVG